MINSEWTLESYSLLCEAVAVSDYKVQTIKEYIHSSSTRSLCMRHDIDRYPKNALKMAELEYEFGIRSTYYIRFLKGIYSDNLVDRLVNLGHEIGYHYETLAKTRGDLVSAQQLFRKEVSQFSRPVFTAAAHGSPMFAQDNKSVVDDDLLKNTGLIGEAYRSIDYNKIAYYTDTGRAWNAQDANFRDRVDSAVSWPKVDSLKNLISLVESQKIPSLCIQTHPERWAYSKFTLIRSKTFDECSTVVKKIIRRLVS